MRRDHAAWKRAQQLEAKVQRAMLPAAELLRHVKADPAAHPAESSTRSPGAAQYGPGPGAIASTALAHLAVEAPRPLSTTAAVFDDSTERGADHVTYDPVNARIVWHGVFHGAARDSAASDSGSESCSRPVKPLQHEDSGIEGLVDEVVRWSGEEGDGRSGGGCGEGDSSTDSDGGESPTRMPRWRQLARQSLSHLPTAAEDAGSDAPRYVPSTYAVQARAERLERSRSVMRLTASVQQRAVATGREAVGRLAADPQFANDARCAPLPLPPLFPRRDHVLTPGPAPPVCAPSRQTPVSSCGPSRARRQAAPPSSPGKRPLASRPCPQLPRASPDRRAAVLGARAAGRRSRRASPSAGGAPTRRS